jgi:hypothetical protein
VRRDVIPDDELRRLVDRHSHRMMSVLVEPRGATASRTLDRAHGEMLPDIIEVAVPALGSTDSERLADDITRMTGRTPQYLRSASAVVVEVSGDQLAELAALPSVAMIRPRRHVHAAHNPRRAGDAR